MDTIKEIESIRNDILDTIAKCECGDDCESVVYLKKIAARLAAISSCCRPLAAAPAAFPTPDGAAPSAPVPSVPQVPVVPSVPSVPSNTAKLREALDLVDEGFSEGCLDAPGDCPTKHDLHRVSVIREKVKSALAAPPRNCDVGTAKEQAERYARHCDAYLRDDGGKPCTTCPCCGKIPYGRCEFAWAQLPYVERREA